MKTQPNNRKRDSTRRGMVVATFKKNKTQISDFKTAREKNRFKCHDIDSDAE